MSLGDHADATKDGAEKRRKSRAKRAPREQSSRALDSATRWPRAEGYARQRTDVGHQHESVFGEPEGAPQEWDCDNS